MKSALVRRCDGNVRHGITPHGAIRKNLYVVPKATHGQSVMTSWIFTHAKILFPEDDDFTPAKRPEFISRAVTGDWDAVIISDSQFERIPVRPETELNSNKRN